MQRVERTFCKSIASRSRNHKRCIFQKGREGIGEGRVRNHTNTTRSYISSNHDGALASLEFVQDPIALVLLFISVNS